MDMNRENRALRSLLAPLDYLLASGGDTRLHLEPVTLLNGYGCRPFPRPEALTFASSTATSISERAFAEARAMYERLIDSALCTPDEHGFAREVIQLRDRLRQLLQINATGCELVLSPSGTDSVLHATVMGQCAMHGPMVSVVVASDETGSGTALAAAGRHFSSLTALGASVIKGETVPGMVEDLQTIGIPLRTYDGLLRSMADIDEETVRTVATQVAAGRHVVLHVMDSSKLGHRAPSPACVRDISSRWREHVQVIVDACQLRLSRRRIHEHLELGHVVQITGSKFFTGPPFSGALLVPPSLADQMARIEAVPVGLCDYTSRASWPVNWAGVQASLPDTTNVGELLRWTAAVAELRDYFAVPEQYRREALARFAVSIPALIQRHGTLELLADYAHEVRAVADNEEFATRTIFPFLMRRDGRPLSFVEATMVYRALNRDLSLLLPEVGADDRRLLAKVCHIGQPVAIRDPSGLLAGALRISAGSRILSETWTPDMPDLSQRKLEDELEQVRIIVDKIHLILQNFDRLAEQKI